MATRSEPFLVFTAAHDEATNLPDLAASLAQQGEGLLARWVVVDDGSSDGTAEVAEQLRMPFPVTVLRRRNAGGLASASELGAFREGAAAGLALEPQAQRVMKLDADLRLRPDHLAVLAEAPATVGLVGGVIDGLSELAQRDHVRGGLRAYSRAALELVAELPTALGWDVLDQVAIRHAGLDVYVDTRAVATTARRTGASVGILAGRRRSGYVCRWTGYVPSYLLLKTARVSVQRPFGIGLLWFLAGYVRAGRSPFPAWLLQVYRSEQRRRLRVLFAHPLRGARAWYARG
jgi:glycosyltransferase involved in cell wall biosynthesis